MDGMRRWEVLYELMEEHGYRTICEVGCKEGRTTEYLLSAFKDSQVYAVDPFADIPNEGESYEKWDFGAIEADFHRRTDEYGDRCVFYKMTSLDAAEHFKAQQLDVVFIDAAHDYENVMADINAWHKKVRPGGLVCGHDWNHNWVGVQRAVADNYNLCHIQTFPDSVWACMV